MKRYTLLVSFILAILAPFYASAEINDLLQDGPPSTNQDFSEIADAIPKPLPFSATGNPDYYDVNGKRYYVLKTNKNYSVQGVASWYGTKFHGKRTSSGEPYDMFAMTAASPELPIPSYVRVTNLKNGRNVIVKVNDRGPFHSERVMDLSYVAAKKLDMLGHGTSLVKIEAIDTGTPIELTENKSHLYVQVATFRQPDNANRVAKQLGSRLDKAVFIEPFKQENAMFYRVLVGPIASMEQSEKLKQSLHLQGFSGGITIRKA